MSPLRTFLASLLLSSVGLGILAVSVRSSEDLPTQLYVRTVPAGAQVLLDGEPLGSSDGLYPVKPGDYRIVIDLEKYEPHEQQITIRNGRITRIELKLRKPPHTPSSATDKDDAPAVSATATGTRPRDFVRLVVGKERMTFEGQDTTWEELPKLLEKVPNPQYTVLCLSPASDSQILAKQKDEAAGRASRLVQDLGFEYLSLVSDQPLGSKGGSSQLIRTSPEGEITLPMAAVTTGARIRQQYFVQLVVGENRMTFEGQDTTWEKLPQLLEQVPNRQRTALCLAVTSDGVTPKQKEEARARAGRLVREHGFGYLSIVGVHPLGSKSGPSQTIQDPSADETRAQRQLLLKVGEADLTFEGRVFQTWKELANAFERVADREHAEILIVAPAQLKQARLVDVIDRTSKLADRMGFLSCRVRMAGPSEPRQGATSRPARREEAGTGEPSPVAQQSKKIHLPDIEGGPGTTVDDYRGVKCMLDLASGHMLAFPDDFLKEPDGPDRFFAEQTQGDLFYAARSLCCMRGAKAMQWDGDCFVRIRSGNSLSAKTGSSPYLTGYHLAKDPCRLLITTAEKKHFDVTIRSITNYDGSVELEYREADPAVVPVEPSPGKQPASSRLNEVFELIEENYFVGLERPDFAEAAIRGVIAELDVHSNYISQTELASLREQVPEKLSGIGLALRFDQSTQELRVETPLPNMPAYRAGVRAGDVVVQIDGKPTSEFPEGKQLQSAVKVIRGKPGGTVIIGLRRSGSDEVEQIEIVREAIRLPAIKGDVCEANGEWDFMLDDDRKIGYVRLTHFNSQSADELRDAVEELQSKGMKAFILDLRNNPGGTLSQAIRVADLFVEDGIIVSVEDRQEPGRTWFAKREGTLGEFPVAVLVNRDSVAAAEIVAACLQDHQRAIIVGERTYGKGTAHKILELRGSAGALKLPTALFHRPNGKGIHRFDGAEAMDTWGVLPDDECEVNLSSEEYGRFMEYRRQRDVLRPEGLPKSDFRDRQLQKAIERL